MGLLPVDAPPVISLSEALQRVAEQSFDLRIAAEEVTQANLQVQKAWALLLPQVSLGGTYSYNFPEQTVEFGNPSQNAQQALLFRSIADVVTSSAQFSQDPAERAAALQQAEQLRQAAQDIESSKPIEVVVQPAHLVSGQLQVSVPLFSGRATPLLQNAYEAVDLSEAVVAQARASLLLAATRAYYGAVSAKRLMSIADEQRTNAERHREALRQREALGLATAIALQRADLDVIRAEQQTRAARQAYGMTLGALGQLMAREELFEVDTPPDVPAVEQLDTADGLIERALKARPEVTVRRSALAIARRMRTDAWMAFLPSLSLIGQGRYTSNTSGFAAEPFTGAVMLQANVPIYDGGTRYATLKETASKILQEELRLEQEERRIRSQVRGNLEDIELKRQALITADRGLALALDTRDNAQRLFDLGVATSLDVIDANLAVFFAQVEQTRAKLEVEQARLGLAFVSGALTPSLVLAPEAPRPAPAQ
ncbi:MAG: TolC family protein [Myxococcota bacterium]